MPWWCSGGGFKETQSVLSMAGTRACKCRIPVRDGNSKWDLPMKLVLTDASAWNQRSLIIGELTVIAQTSMVRKDMRPYIYLGGPDVKSLPMAAL